jgi:hypothetical protein
MMLNSASVNPFDRNGIEIDPFQTADIDCPSIEWLDSFLQFLRRRIAGPSERKDAACRAEEVLSRSRPPLIQRKILPGAQQTKLLFGHSMIQCSAPPTDRAVTGSHMVDLRLDFKGDPSAVTRPSIDLHDASRRWSAACVFTRWEDMHAWRSVSLEVILQSTYLTTICPGIPRMPDAGRA